MKPLDWAILAVLAISVIQGLRRGIVVSVISLAGFIAGIVLAGRYWTLALPVAAWLAKAAWARQLWAYFLVLLAVWMLTIVLAHLLRRVARTLGLGPLDRLLGAMFGLVRGFVVVVLGFVLIAAIAPAALRPEESRWAPLFLAAAQSVLHGAPSAAAAKAWSGLQRENLGPR